MAKVFIEESTLTAIGDAIRGKEGSSELVPVTDMATRITDLPSGGSSEEYFSDEDLTFTNYLPNNFMSGSLSAKILANEGTRIKMENISDGYYLFNNIGQMDLSHLTISLDNCNMSAMFHNTSATALPKLTGSVSSMQQNTFYNAQYLRYLPEGMDTLDYSTLHERNEWLESIFSNCYSLRQFPTAALRQIWNAGTSFTLYRYGFNNCYALDELVGIPVYETLDSSSNQFDYTFNGCYRLKNVIFETEANGAPKKANWKNQVIDLTPCVGYAGNGTYVIKYNSGITEDKFVNDTATYEALKNDPDWFAADPNYSRYNHASAVATINSLPDTSDSGGTNTIKFNKVCGIWTDGGAINALTESEIAVAVIKGWTVSLA